MSTKEERQKKYRQSDGFILPKKVGNATGEDVEPHWGQVPLTNGSKWGADYFYSFNPFISYTLFLLLCLINSFFGTFEKTQLQIEHFLEHLAKWHCR